MEEGNIFLEQIVILLIGRSGLPFFIEAAEDGFFIFSDFRFWLGRVVVLLQHIFLNYLSMINSYL